jgi:undecaprenyl-diphosphatase
VVPNVAGSNPVDRPLFSEVPLSLWFAILLGLVQGITEFLPVSSSGHLRLLEALLSSAGPADWLTLEVVCHLGTAAAALVVLRHELLALLQAPYQRLAHVILGTLPLVVLAPLATTLTLLLMRPHTLGFCFFITAGLLLASERWTTVARAVRWYHALGIGSCQALALLPGISRSGSTIAAARLMGWTRAAAVRFSFLLSLPAVMGSAFLQVFCRPRSETAAAQLSWMVHSVAFVTAFVTGFFVLRAFLRFVEQSSLRPFGWYCLGLGVTVIVLRLA